jgi:CBS domain-containing protein
MGKAMEIMLEKQIGSLPVLEDGVLLGIITESDFLRSF